MKPVVITQDAAQRALVKLDRLRIQVSMLRTACELALRWVKNMRIVPGGERDKLRQALELALGSSEPDNTEE